MYTVEMDHDEIEIYVIDERNNHEELVINAYDDIVFLRQWDEDKKCHDVITLSPDMWEELIMALHSPEGSFKVKKKNN
jgi:hypothetical protein